MKTDFLSEFSEFEDHNYAKNLQTGTIFELDL